MLNISQQRNVNKIVMRYYFIPTVVSKIKRTGNTMCQWGYGETESSYVLIGIVKLCSHFGEQFGNFWKCET